LTPTPGRRLRRFTAGGLVAVTATVAAIVATSTGDPDPGKANLWIDANGGDCVRQAIADTYEDGDACATFTAAYQAAEAGDTVKVKAGSYPVQNIVGKNITTGNRVVFRPADDETVYVGSINVYRSKIELRDFRLNNNDVLIREIDIGEPPHPPVNDVKVDGLSGRNFNIFNATNVTIRRGEYGPASACGGAYGGGNNSIRNVAGEVNPSNIVIEDLVLHDVQSFDLEACHTECLAIFAGENVLLQRVKFYNCSIYNVFVQDNSGPVSDLSFINNQFAAPTSPTGVINGTGIGFSTVPPNTKLLNNSSQRQFSIHENDQPASDPAYDTWEMHGNIAPIVFDTCAYAAQMAVYTYNTAIPQPAGDLNDAGPCPGAGNQKVATIPFKGGGTLGEGANLNLAPGTILENAIPAPGPQMHGVTKDYARQTRPIGPGSDIGSDERGTADPR
jgi:hypothetical protein